MTAIGEHGVPVDGSHQREAAQARRDRCLQPPLGRAGEAEAVRHRAQLAGLQEAADGRQETPEGELANQPFLSIVLQCTCSRHYTIFVYTRYINIYIYIPVLYIYIIIYVLCICNVFKSSLKYVASQNDNAVLEGELTLLEPQSRFGDKPLKFQVVCPQNGTAVLKELTLPFCRIKGDDSNLFFFPSSFKAI